MRLLVLKVNQLGDNVVFLPVVQGLRKAFPDWQITVATSPVAAPLYRTTCPQVEVLEFETSSLNAAWRSPAQFGSYLSRIRQVAPQACLVAGDQGNVAHLLARLSGARHCIGQRVAGMKTGFLMHQRADISVGMPVAAQNWALAQTLLERLGAPPLAESPPPPDLTAFGRTDHGCILIHAGASRAYQRWPLSRYVKLANRLSARHPVIWIDQGQPIEEDHLSPDIRREKTTGLEGFIRLMAGAAFFVGNNSGPAHIASALDIPGLVLTGPSARLWDPFWHADKLEVLRDPVLPCQPCDLPTGPVNVCQNRTHLHACLERWSVDQIHDNIAARLHTRTD